jgi:protein gp37
MAANTKIQWTDETWNITLGCTKVSDGCDNCYAIPEAWMRQHHNNPKVAEAFAGTVTKNPDGTLDWTGRINLLDERLDQPKHWRKPRRIFVNSMSDVFAARVPVDFVTKIWATMQDTPRHTYQILTKRPERVARVLAKVHAELGLTEPLPNVWLGTSIESDDHVRRADHLRQAPAAVRFVSAEPLLGPLPSLDVHGIDWVILGGESSKKKTDARPLELGWVRDLMDRCRTADAAVFVKQLGAVWARENGAVDKKGGEPEEWPADLRVREFPAAA